MHQLNFYGISSLIHYGTDVCHAETEIWSPVCSLDTYIPVSSTYEIDEPYSFGGGDKWWWKNNFHRDQILCRHYWSILCADLPLTAEGQFLLLNHYRIIVVLELQRHIKKGQRKSPFHGFFKYCRDSFISNYVLALKSYTCLKIFLWNKGGIKHKSVTVCFSHD